MLDANEQWIAFLDSDDAWLPGHLEAIREAIIDTGGAADLYFGNSWFSREAGRERSLWSVSQFEVSGRHELRADASEWMMRTRQALKLQGSVVRRDAWDRVSGLDETLRTREDTHFFLRLGLGHPMCAVRDAGVDVGDDDDPENRLTTALPPDGRVYLEATAYLYGDLLRLGLARDPLHRAELRRRYGPRVPPARTARPARARLERGLPTRGQWCLGSAGDGARYAAARLEIAGDRSP